MFVASDRGVRRVQLRTATNDWLGAEGVRVGEQEPGRRRALPTPLRELLNTVTAAHWYQQAASVHAVKRFMLSMLYMVQLVCR